MKRPLVAYAKDQRMDNWDYTYVKSFCSAKKTIKSDQLAYRMGEISASTPGRKLISRIYAELQR